MTNMTYQQEPIDPQVEEMLEALRRTPERNPQTVEAGKARYLAELGELDLPEKTTSSVLLATWLANINQLKEKVFMSTKKVVTSTVFVLIMVFVLLFGGAGATAYAAQNALPGDALYSLKTGLEDTQVRLSSDAAKQAELYLGFAEKRLDEIARLIAQKRYDDISVATQDFERNIQRAIGALQIAAQGDPQVAAGLATKVTDALTRYASILSGMLMQVPDAVKPEVERAISISQTGSTVDSTGEIEFTGMVESMSDGMWVVGGRSIAINLTTEVMSAIVVGDMVKVHALVAEDGSLTAREIELEMVDDDNLNDNDDDNLNDNEDDNLNDNDDDNLNDNEDDNLNDNDDDNLNDNEDDNLNDNDDDNVNDNTNDNDDDNTNDNDDDNVNDNDDDNVNDNDDDNDNY